MNEHTEARAPRELIIVFLDLSFFTKDASHRDEAVVADTIDRYYERVAEHTASVGGSVVKYIGDGALLAFPMDRGDDMLVALFALRREVDKWLAAEGWASRLTIKAHCGSVIAGAYGPRGAKRFDVIGNVVNVAARLPRPFHLSPQVFRLLSPVGRKLLKKHTPPVTYIPVDDHHG